MNSNARTIAESFSGGWNTRLIRGRNKLGEWVAIHEVYYDAAGNVTSWTESPCVLSGEDVEDVRGYMHLLSQAFSRPVLNMDELEAMYLGNSNE